MFPLLPESKKPAVKWTQYCDEAPTSEELLAWDASDCNVGIACGPSNILVLDGDSDDALAYIASLNLPDTPTVKTARGKHFYFGMPDTPVGNAVKVGGRKMDLRGHGGYVVAPPSIHETGAVYEWEIHPSTVPFADFPMELLDLKKDRTPKPRATASSVAAANLGSIAEEGPQRYVDEELHIACAELTVTESGSRNDTLFKVAVRMARHVAGAGVDWACYTDALTDAAMEAGLEPEETANTLASAWNAGSAEPTPWLQVADAYVYLAFQERYYHVQSGTDLKVTGFNDAYRSLYRGKGTLSHFLQANNYVRKVHDLDYQPLNPAQMIERDGLRYLNTYTPSSVMPVPGDAYRFIDFMEYLFPDVAEREHIVKVLAYTARHPGHKIGHALMIRSSQHGVGKSMLIDIWCRLIGEKNVRKTTSKEINSEYQGYVPQKLLIVCEEFSLGTGRNAYNDLKDLITGTSSLVNEKHLRQREWTNHAIFVFLTNLETPILIEDKDRRFHFSNAAETKRSPEYFTEFVAWWKANLGVIRAYLDGVDLSAFNPHAPPPMTEAKARLIESSKSDLAHEIMMAISKRDGPFSCDVSTLEDIQRYLGTHRSHGVRALKRALEEVGGYGIGQHRLPGKSGRASLWVIRNFDYWRYIPGREAADEYCRLVGGLVHYDIPGFTVLHHSLMPKPQGACIGGQAQEWEALLA